MPGGNASLLDSNILLRLSKSDDPRHAAISHALRALVGQGYGSATPADAWGVRPGNTSLYSQDSSRCRSETRLSTTKSLEIFGTSTYLSYR